MRHFRLGAAMSVLLMLAACGGGEPVVRNFTSSQNVVIPANVNSLTTLTGKGQDGTPYQAGEYGYDTYKTVTVRSKSPGNPIISGPTTTYEGRTTYQEPPQPLCSTTNGSGDTTTTTTCYSYERYDNSTPAVRGDDSYGFGRPFAGGDGVPAQEVLYNNVPLSGGATVPGGKSYPITVPLGGYITITYYQ